MLILLLSLFVYAGEPDNFSGRNTPPQNTVVNNYFQKLLTEVAFYHNTNNKGKSACNEKLLTQLMEKRFDTNWPSVTGLQFEMKPDGPGDIDKSVIAGTMKSLFMVPSLTLKLQGKNYSVGLDKLDHFFSHGYLYWKIVGQDPALPKEQVQKALKLGVEQENGAWGLKSSGVKSFGDLSANYQGLSFWRDLRHGKPPFFSCKDGQIQIKKKFDIAEYMTGAVDEAINCSSYATPEMAKSIIQKTEKLNRKCPLDIDQCHKFAQQVPEDFAESLLHPLCRNQASDQVEKPTPLTTKDLMDMANALVGDRENLRMTFFPNMEKPQNERVVNKPPVGKEQPAPAKSGGAQ